mgnify:CR=1 FL=1
MAGAARSATSTARVEISVSPVNDAPRDRDTVHWIRLGLDTTITVADLMSNTYDIEDYSDYVFRSEVYLVGLSGRNYFDLRLRYYQSIFDVNLQIAQLRRATGVEVAR